MDLRLAHISMQHSDTAAQQRSDAHRIFNRALGMHYAWITGTEANSFAVARIFSEEAIKAGFRFVRGGDCWIAVPLSRIAGRWRREWTKVIDGQAGKFPDRGVLRASWDDKTHGDTTVLASHYQTKRTSAKRPQDNIAISVEIGKQGKIHGDGRRLCFYGGDQNITDRTGDTFKGKPFTSCWDELEKWPNTGHDNIDVIASYDYDHRVTAKSAQALTDKDFHLHSDHFLIEATYAVAPLNPKHKAAKT